MCVARDAGARGRMGAAPPAVEEGGRSALIILSSNKGFVTISCYICTITFVPLSSRLENGEFHTVDGRQSNEALEHLSFIGSFSDVVESVILQFFFCWQASDPRFLPLTSTLQLK